MDHLKYLIENNIVCLEQGIHLLKEIKNEVYTHSDPPVYTSGIGDHYRHCIEHYLSFLNGIDARCVDYDARKRDLRRPKMALKTTGPACPGFHKSFTANDLRHS